MTTFDERIRALVWGRHLIEELCAAGEGDGERDIAPWLLPNYPPAVEIDDRLERCRGYSLLLAVRSFERTSGLLERLVYCADDATSERAKRIARHFPQRQELAAAIRSPFEARSWAAMYLDRSPGRSAFLRYDRATVDSRALTKAQRRQRRQALRQLGAVLSRLQHDPAISPFALSEIRQVIARLPGPALLGRRFSGVDLGALNDCLRAMQRGCQLLEAVAEGTFPASRRSRALALQQARHLPAGEWFPFNAVCKEYRQAWIDALFLRRGRRISWGALQTVGEDAR